MISDSIYDILDDDSRHNEASKEIIARLLTIIKELESNRSNNNSNLCINCMSTNLTTTNTSTNTHSIPSVIQEASNDYLKYHRSIKSSKDGELRELKQKLSVAESRINELSLQKDGDNYQELLIQCKVQLADKDHDCEVLRLKCSELQQLVSSQCEFIQILRKSIEADSV